MPERLLTAALLCAALTACGRGPEAVWDDYISRLERLARSDALATSAPTPPRYPRHRDLRQSLPDQRTGLMCYLELKRCGLREMVSRRNSSLGKLQAPSLRLAYELEFVHRARACLEANTLADDPEMHRWLRQTVKTKESALPALMWNLSLAGNELAGFFSFSRGAAAGGAPQESAATLRALETLARLAAQVSSSVPPPDTGRLESALATLDRSEAGGQLIMGMALAQRELRRANTLLASIEPARLCPDGRAGRRARRLNNVFSRIYAERVQPWLSSLWRAADPLADRMTALRRSLAVDSAALDAWLDATFSKDGLHGHLEAAIRDHAGQWQRLLEPCDLAPARPTG